MLFHGNAMNMNAHIHTARGIHAYIGTGVVYLPLLQYIRLKMKKKSGLNVNNVEIKSLAHTHTHTLQMKARREIAEKARTRASNTFKVIEFAIP